MAHGFRRGLWLLLLATAWGCGGSTDPGEARPSVAKKDVVFVGFDASEPLVRALRQGTLQGLVVQNPLRMGELAVKTLVEHLEKADVDRKISTGETLATPENMTDPEVAALLAPPRSGQAAELTPGNAKGKTWRVMVIPKGTTHQFWQTIHAGALKAAEELGNVEVDWQGPLKEDDRAAQIQLVQTAVKKRVDGIALAPLDDRALVGPVEAAIAAGIPVVIFDSALNSEKPISYVATDNYHGGVLAAERLAKQLHGEGKIILVRYMVGSASTEEREQGFVDTIKKYPKIEYLSGADPEHSEYAGATSDTAQKVAQNLVTRFKGQVDGIFTPNESSTSGMLRALRDAGMVGGNP